MRTNIIRSIIIAESLMVFALFSSCKKEKNPTQKYEVTMVNNEFNPVSLAVPIGSVVTWRNKENVKHTVSSTTNAFDSGELMKEETFTYTFTSPGSYGYYCKLHSNMKGTIVVQ
jgi:plastocyanin